MGRGILLISVLWQFLPRIFEDAPVGCDVITRPNHKLSLATARAKSAALSTIVLLYNWHRSLGSEESYYIP